MTQFALFAPVKKPNWNRSKGKTLLLWGEGLEVAQIVKRRNREVTTIQSHLVDAVALGKLSVDQFVDPGDIEFVREVFEELGTTDLTPVYSECDQIFDYFELNAVRAHFAYLARTEPPVTSSGQPDTQEEAEEATHFLFLAVRKREHAERTGFKWVVAVKSASQWASICAAEEEVETVAEWRRAAKRLVFPNKHKQYSSVRVDEEVRGATSQVQAFMAAYAWAEELKKEGKTAEVHGDRVDSRIYAFIMHSDVWAKGKFRDANPHIGEADRGNVLCLYVGQTSKSIEDRFHIHRSNARGSTTWGRKYFLEDFEEAFDANVQGFVAEFQDLAAWQGQLDMAHLKHGQSIILETKFGEWLRYQGYATYFA